MSLLADLLSRAKNEGEKNTTIPPHLASIVARASDKKKRQTKLIITAAIVLFVVIAGFAIVYYLDAFMGPSLIKKTASVPVRPIPQAPPAAVQQPPAETPQKVDAPTAPQVNTTPEEPKKTIKAAGAPPKTELPAEPGAATTARGPVVVKGLKKDSAERTGKSVEGRTRGGEDKRKSDRDVSLYAARSYEESGNLAQAIVYYKKALQLDGQNYIIMTSLTGALIKTGAYDEALKYSRFAVNTNRNYVPAMINLAISSIRLGNFEEGEQNLVRARSLEPANKAVLYNLGLLYENQKRYQEACTVYEKVPNGQGLIGMARVLEKQGKRDDARKIYRDILSSGSADAKTKQYANERLVAIGNNQ